MTLSRPLPEALSIPTNISRLFLRAYEEILGQPGLTAVIKLSGAQGLLQTESSDRSPHADDIGKLHETLEKMFGPRAGRGLALRAGRVFFKYGLKQYGPDIGIEDLGFRLLPLPGKIDRGGQIIAEMINAYAGDTIAVKSTPTSLHLHIDRCPLCWNRTTGTPCCHMAIGLVQEALYWMSGGKNYQVEETACAAMGDRHCVIEVDRTPLD